MFIILAFLGGFIFAYFTIAICVSGVVIIDEDKSAIKVSFNSTKALLKNKFVILRVEHGEIEKEHTRK